MTEWTPEQQREHRKIWVEALRSGKYKQAKDALREPSTKGMCCLGVACDVSHLGEWHGHAYHTPDGTNDGELETADIRDWLGLANQAGVFDGYSLAEMNDNGASFDIIADKIEEEPAGLLK